MAKFLTGTDRGLGGLRVNDDVDDVYGVTHITVSAATLVDNGGGHVTITTGGGGGSGTVTNIATAGTVNGVTLTGGPITATGTITLGGTLAINNTDWSGTALSATNGGTAQTTYATGDVLYASGTNTLAKLPAGTDTHVLTLASGVPEWAPSSGGTGTVTSVSTTLSGISIATATTTPAISGTLGATNGGTAQTTYATGDVLYASGTNTLAKLPAGTDTHVLTLASGVPEWAPSSGGGVTLVGSTNNTIPTVTGANALIGEAELTFDSATTQLVNLGGAIASPEPTTGIIHGYGGLVSGYAPRNTGTILNYGATQTQGWSALSSQTTEFIDTNLYGPISANPSSVLILTSTLSPFSWADPDPSVMGTTFTIVNEAGQSGGSITAGTGIAPLPVGGPIDGFSTITLVDPNSSVTIWADGHSNSWRVVGDSGNVLYA